HRRPRRRAAPRGRSVLRGRLASTPLRPGRPLPVEPRSAGRAGRGATDRRRCSAAVRTLRTFRRRSLMSTTRRTAGSRRTVPRAEIRTTVTVPLRFGDGYSAVATVVSFDGLVDGREHVALGLGPYASHVDGSPAPLVRPHSECLTGDIFGSQRC